MQKAATIWVCYKDRIKFNGEHNLFNILQVLFQPRLAVCHLECRYIPLIHSGIVPKHHPITVSNKLLNIHKNISFSNMSVALCQIITTLKTDQLRNRTHKYVFRIFF